MTVNFTKVEDIRQHPIGIPHDYRPVKKGVPLSADGKMLTPKQIRARARRKGKRANIMSDQELEYLYQKPVADWDLEELGHGRPRNAQGNFKGPKPKWINTAVHEEAMEKYRAAVKSKMNETTVDALGLIKDLIGNDDVDDKGKPIVPASTKLDAAKFLIEHVVGKPTQRIEGDISVKLQGILGQVMVNPTELTGGNQGYEVAHYPGITMELGQAQDGDDDDYIDAELA